MLRDGKGESINHWTLSKKNKVLNILDWKEALL